MLTTHEVEDFLSFLLFLFRYPKKTQSQVLPVPPSFHKKILHTHSL